MTTPTDTPTITLDPITLYTVRRGYLGACLETVAWLNEESTHAVSLEVSRLTRALETAGQLLTLDFALGEFPYQTLRAAAQHRVDPAVYPVLGEPLVRRAIALLRMAPGLSTAWEEEAPTQQYRLQRALSGRT